MTGRFRVRLLTAGTVLLACAAAFAPPAPTTRPAAVDYVKDLIDDYHQGRERALFFEAAGTDGELAKEEWAAAAAKANSFVRIYDRWEGAAVFDRDRNGKLNWPEAEEYRLSVQKRVLTLFDKDKDGRLVGEERQVANAFLAGHPRVAVAPASRPAVAPAGGLPPGEEPKPATFADGGTSGVYTADEQHASFEAFRQQFNERVLIDYDADGDGELSEKERKAMDDGYRKHGKEWQNHWEVVRWDTNMDGKLDAAERRVMEEEKAAHLRRQDEQRAEWISQWDTDGDGKLSPEEERAVTAHWQQALQRQREEMDADGDGKISGDEIWVYRQKIFDEMRLRREEAASRAATQKS